MAEPAGYRFSAEDHGAEWWLPASEPAENLQPQFQAHVRLVRPPGFSADWVDLLEEWDLEKLADRLIAVS